ncbi:hypothetical protein EON83_07675, partial [bacterium]
MNASPFRRTTNRLAPHRRLRRVSPFALTLLALPLATSLAQAQDTNKPAAVPEDQPRGLQTPAGPVLGPSPT